MIRAFKATIVQMLVDVDLNDIYDVEAVAPNNHMRRRLLAANEATVSYKVRATSKAQATQAKTDMVKGNDEFTHILKTEMVKNDVEGKTIREMSTTRYKTASFREVWQNCARGNLIWEYLCGIALNFQKSWYKLLHRL